jgi:hypothetical protein
MFIDNIEASYLQTRLQGSLDMANAAMGPCARASHEGLAKLYRGRLSSLRRPAPINAIMKL